VHARHGRRCAETGSPRDRRSCVASQPGKSSGEDPGSRADCSRDQGRPNPRGSGACGVRCYH
jgi:hypothetical protein